MDINGNINIQEIKINTMIKFKEKTIRVYHVTKDTNVESIKRDGLLVEKYKKPSGNFFRR